MTDENRRRNARDELDRAEVCLREAQALQGAVGRGRLTAHTLSKDSTAENGKAAEISW